MEEEYESLQHSGEFEDVSPGGDKTKHLSVANSQATINLHPVTDTKSDFVMQADIKKQADDDHLHAMFNKEQGDETVSEQKVSEEQTTKDSFIEGEETEAFSVDDYDYQGAYEEDYDGELEADYEAWHQGYDMSEEVTPPKVVVKRSRERLKRKSTTGDFGMLVQDSSTLFTTHKLKSFGSVYMKPEGGTPASSEEDLKVEATEEEEEVIDREPYYELYKSLLQEYPMAKMKNNFLQRKMAEYFKKRKMEHVLREADRVGDAEQKYYTKLDALWELKNTNDMQRNALTAELNEMRDLRDKQYNSVLTNFEAMLAREKEIGTGLIFTKTAKEIPEKFLERLIKNQRLKSNEITDMRLKYIKLRNSIEEISAAIRAMDKIGENHTLIDYEQLKMENQNYSDKIEERDEELSKLREKCSGAIQTLAHLREKSAAMDIDILDMAERLEEAVYEKNEFRERVGQLKHERDTLRSNIVKLQEESGLLTKQKLLLDMEETIDQILTTKKEIERIEKTYNDNAKALDIIKHNIKVEREIYQCSPYKVEEPPKAKQGTTNKGNKVSTGFGYKNKGLEKFNVEL